MLQIISIDAIKNAYNTRINASTMKVSAEVNKKFRENEAVETSANTAKVCVNVMLINVFFKLIFDVIESYCEKRR